MLDDILSGDLWDEIFAYIGYMIPLKKMRIKWTCSPWSHDTDVTIAQSLETLKIG